MNDINAKTENWLNAMAAHVLQHGLNTASLRPLAAAAGTSDRMLIYHFGNKDGVIAALLKHLAAQFTAALSASASGPAPSRHALVAEVMTLQRRPEMRGFIRVWFDIIAASAQGVDAHKDTGHAIINHFCDWLQSRLPADDPDPETTAKALLTVIEGMALMDALGQTDLANAALERLVRD